MPNWVTNKLTFEGEGKEDLIKSLLTKDSESDEEYFDFNKIIKMPEELLVEKSSRSREGLLLYIAAINPLIPNIGSEDDKMSFDDFSNRMVKTFPDAVKNMPKYIIKPSEIEEIKKKYTKNYGDKADKELKETLELGKKVFHNIETYGYPDWYEWSYDKWGCKWNSSCTYYNLEEGKVYFDTPWGPSVPVIEELARQHPEMKITHEYAEEQIAFMCGKVEYDKGELQSNEPYPSYSKDAFELYFELWGCEEDFKYDEAKGTYVEKNEGEME